MNLPDPVNLVTQLSKSILIHNRGTDLLFKAFVTQGALESRPKSIYNPITAMGLLTMFTFQKDNTKR